MATDDLPDAPWANGDNELRDHFATIQAGAGETASDDEPETTGTADVQGGDNLPDAPWASGTQRSELPDAPWATKEAPEPEGPLATGIRAAGHSIIPAIGSLPAIGAGAKLGAMAGAPFGPLAAGVGTVGGGLIGALGGGYLLSKAQDYIADFFGINDTEQRQVNEEANPKSAFLGELAPNAAAFGMGAVPKLARAAGAGIMGGLEAGQEYANEGKFDPVKIAMSAGFGAAFAKPTALGERGMSLGEKLVPGRPNFRVPPEAAQAQADATATPPPNVAQGTAQAKPPPPGAAPGGGQAKTTSETIGNPQSAVQGSSRAGAKETAPPGPGAVTEGQTPPDQAAALEAVFGGPSANAPKPAAPAEPQPPVHTGIEEAAQAQRPRFQPPGDPALEAARMTREATDNVHRRISDQQKGEAFQPDNYTGEERRNADRPGAPQRAPEEGSDAAIEGATQRAIESFDHPDLPNVKVARDQPVKYLAGSSKDMKTVYIDPTVPKTIDVNGMVIDPALPLAVHEIHERAAQHVLRQEIAKGKLSEMTDEQIYRAAHEHGGTAAEKKYLEEQFGFEPKDWDRYQEIMHETAAKTEHEGAAADRRMPADLYDPDGKEMPHGKGSRTGTEAPAEAGAAPKAPAREPVASIRGARAIAKATKDLRAAGKEEFAKAIENAKPEHQGQMARKALEILARPEGKIKEGDYAVPRVPNKPPMSEVLGVQVRDAADKARKEDAIGKVKAAFEKAAPKTDETVDEFKQRVNAAVLQAGEAAQSYKPKVPPAEWLWMREARKLVQGRMTKKQIATFIANEKQLRSGNPEDVENVRGTKRIESDIGKRRTPTVEEAEASAARTDQVPEVEHEVDLSKHEPEEVAKIAEALDQPELTEQEHKGPTAKEIEDQRLAAVADKNTKLKALREAAKGAKAGVAEGEKSIGTLLKDLAKNESGSGNPTAIGAALKDANNRLTSIRDRNAVKAAEAREPGYIAKDPKNVKGEHGRSAEKPERYARKVDQQLHDLGNSDTVAANEMLNALDRMAEPSKKDKATLEKIYHAHEAGDVTSLTPAEKAFYDAEVKPRLDRIETMRELVRAIDPDVVGEDVLNHIMHIRAGNTPKTDMLSGVGASMNADPMGARNLKTGERTTLHDRVFKSLERDSDGKKIVVSGTDDALGFTAWNKWQATPIKIATELAMGEKIKIGNETYTVKAALTKDIEANARFEDGAKAKYYHNPILSATIAEQELGSLLRHMQFMHDLKSNPEFLKYATPHYAEAKAKGWTKNRTELPQFGGWFFDPRVQMVLDDYALSGFKGFEALRNVSTAVTRLLFWMPTAHAMNVGVHWFVERGWDWITPGGYHSLAVDGMRAIKAGMDGRQSGEQKRLLDAGASLVLPGINSKDFMPQVMKSLDMSFKEQPAFWDPIAKSLGVGPSTLLKSIYKGSQQLMWGASDIMMMQAIFANERKGMTTRQAIDTAERHIPNYRVPTTLISSGAAGRWMAKAMTDQGIASFGRYHYGIMNSYAHMVKDLASGNGPRTVEAVGNLMAMGLFAFVVKGALDQMAQVVSGNDKAEAYPRGAITLPTHIVRSLQGKEDFASGIRGLATVSPLAQTGLQVLSGKDFAGRDIIEKNTMARAARGDVTAAGKVGLEGADFLGRNLVSPYGTFSNAAQGGRNPLEAIRDSAFDIKNPSQKASNFSAKQPLTNQQRERSRTLNPRSPLEGAYDKLTRPSSE